MSRYTPTLERPSSSGEGSSGGRTQEQGDYFSTFAMGGPQRNTHIFGDLGGYQMASNQRTPVFDFTPRTRPGLWTEAEAPETGYRGAALWDQEDDSWIVPPPEDEAPPSFADACVMR